MSKPRYPKTRKSRWRLSFLAAIFLVLVCLLGTQFFGPKKETLFNGQFATASASTAAGSSLAEYPQGPLPEGLTFDRLLLEKSERKLTAFHQDEPVRVYLVALGQEPVGHKQFQGDMKTPEGAYTINDKNPNSAYYKNLGISYPNQADRQFARQNGKSPGGDIKIHGLAPSFASLGAAHRITDWTFGCIAVTNPEIEELYSRTPIGTPITIVP